MTRALDLAERLAEIVRTQEEIASAGFDLDDVLQTVVHHLRKLTDATGAVIEVIEGDEMVYRAASGSAMPHIGARLKLASSLSGKCVQTGETLNCEDSERDPRVDLGACRRIGARSMVVVPLLHDEHPVGVLKVLSNEPNAFDELDVYSLQLLAGLIAAAMSHADEYRAKEETERRYRLLFEECLAGAFQTTPQGRFGDCNDALARMLGYESREELIGLETWDLYFDRADREAFIETLRQEKTLRDFPLRLKKQDGSPLEARVNVSMMTSGEQSYVVGTLLPQESVRT